MKSEELLSMLEGSGALLRGHFLLSSGRHSPAYVQCARLLEDPRRACKVGQALAERLRGYGPASILSPALGGVLIGHECAEALGVPFRFCERVGAELSLRRGFELRPGERIAVVEDVVTTGKSTRETLSIAQHFGAEPVAIGCILDRRTSLPELPAPVVALARLELPSYSPEECPACRQGLPFDKPGSRPSPP